MTIEAIAKQTNRIPGLKPAGMRFVALIGVAMAVCIVSLAAIPATRKTEVPNQPTTAHASLIAYPSAVISLKDPRSGMIFYVETNGRQLVALRDDGTIAWSIDVMKAANVQVGNGEPVIRHLSVSDQKLEVTCGKSDSVDVDIATGKATYRGRD